MTAMTATAAPARERPIIFSGGMVRAILDGRKTQTRRVLMPQPDASLDRPPFRSVTRFRDTGVDVATCRAVFEAGDARGAINAFTAGRHCIKSDIACPFGAVGGRLYVRETFTERSVTGWSAAHGEQDADVVTYRADVGRFDGEKVKWRPAIHMPRDLSRITLEITGVGVERLQDITEEDAKAEGVAPEFEVDVAAFVTGRGPLPTTYRFGFKHLWDTLNGPRGYGWKANPFVWRIAFKPVD